MTAAGLPTWMLPPEAAGRSTDGASDDQGTDVWEATVITRRQVASACVLLELAPVSGQVPQWEPGAHVDVHIPKSESQIRQYSLCGDPHDRDSVCIAVLREEDGRGGSVYLHDVVEVGDVLRLGGPRNNFRLKPSPAFVFIAGGIGITPLLPMIEHACLAGAEWSLTYCGGTLSSMPFLERLDQYRNEVGVVATDESGRPDLVALLREPRTDCLIYCCGPESMLLAVEAASAHWPPDALHVERFRPRTDRSYGPEEAFEIVLDRSGRTVTIPKDRSILDVLSEQGIVLPSSCREGTCGTCETDVISGEIDHRDSLLTDAEKSANNCMMICVSRSSGSQLVLDL